jgi:hypothetical protein
VGCTGTATTGVGAAHKFFTCFKSKCRHQFVYLAAVALGAVDRWGATHYQLFKVFSAASTVVFINRHLKHTSLYLKITVITLFRNYFLGRLDRPHKI